MIGKVEGACAEALEQGVELAEFVRGEVDLDVVGDFAVGEDDGDQNGGRFAGHFGDATLLR